MLLFGNHLLPLSCWALLEVLKVPPTYREWNNLIDEIAKLLVSCAFILR
jgi:hypothetical protein